MEPLRATTSLADREQWGPPNFQMSESEAGGSPAPRLRILIVDDETLLADTTAAILRRAGFDAKTAYDGFAALEAMASFHPNYLLTDVVMPIMSGVELAIAASKKYPKTRIMLFSGQAGIADVLEEGKANGFEFPLLAKPVHPLKLIEAIKNLKNG